MAEAQAPAAPAASNSGSGKGAMIFQLVFAVINFAVMGLGTFWTYKSTLGWHSPEYTEDMAQEEIKQEEAHGGGAHADAPLIFTMDKFTVNLAGEPKRTVRIEVNLEMLGREGFEEVMTTDNRARIRDKVVRLLNEKNFNEIETLQGKLFLKEAITETVNHILDKGVVKDIYFSEFVVQ